MATKCVTYISCVIVLQSTRPNRVADSNVNAVAELKISRTQNAHSDRTPFKAVGRWACAAKCCRTLPSHARALKLDALIRICVLGLLMHSAWRITELMAALPCSSSS
jgi:hypothetical protein